MNKTKIVSGITGAAVLLVAALFALNNGNVVISRSGTAAQHLVVDLQWVQYKSVTITGQYVDVYNANVVGSQSHGVDIKGQHILVDGFSVSDGVNENRLSSGGCGNAQWGSGVKVELGGDDITIQNGTVSRNCGEGVAITRGKNVVVQNVTATDNYSVNFYVDNSSRVTIQNSTSICGDPTYYRSGEPANSILLGEENYPNWGTQLGDLFILSNYATGCKGIRLYEQFANGGLKGATIAYNTIAQVWKNAVPISIASYPQNSGIYIVDNIFPPYVSPVSTPTPTRTATVIPSPTKTVTISPAPSLILATNTSTPTATPAPTKTPTATVSITSTPTMACGPVGQWDVCIRPKQ